MKEKLNLFDLVNACILLIIAFIFSKRYIFSGLGYDEHGYISMGYFLSDGLVPYKDFFELKSIGIILMNALGYKLFGIENCAFKYIEFIFLFPTIIIFYLSLVHYKISRLLSFFIVYYSVFLILYPDFHYISLNDSETYGFIFSILSFCSLIFKMKTKAYLPCFLSGVFMAMAFLSKEPFFFSLSPFSLLVFFDTNPFKTNLKRFLSIVIGVLSVIITFFAYLFFNGAIDGFLEKLDYSVAYCNQYDSLFKNNLSNKSFLDTIFFDIENIIFKHNYLSMFFPFVGLYIYSIVFSKNKSKLLIYISSALIGLWSISIGHLFFEKYFILGLFPMIALCIPGAESISHHAEKASSKFYVYVFIVSFTILSSTYKTDFNLVKETLTSYIPANLIDFQDENFKKIVLPLVERITTKDDKVFFIGWMSMYACAKRKPATRYYYVSDRALEINSKFLSSKQRMGNLIHDLELNKPKVIYVDENWNKGEASKTYKNYIIPFIKRHKYLNCSHGLYLKSPIKGIPLGEITRFCSNLKSYE